MRAILISTVSIVTAWLALPLGGADAGTYRVAQCHPAFEVGPADVVFGRTSEHYRSEAACGPGHGGLAVIHDAAHTKAGRWGGWTATAPDGTSFARASVVVGGNSAGGHRPQFLVGPVSQLVPFGSAAGDFHRINWQGAGAERVRAALTCARSTCGRGADARIRIRRLTLDLVDSSPPRLSSVAGSLLAPRSRRGPHPVTASVVDSGGGIHRLFLGINGNPVAAETLDCALRGMVAVRLRPCPARADAGFMADTTQPPFRQGPNRVRICATDYAPDTAAGRDCVTRRVRVDNACPVSEVGTGRTVRFHVRRSGHGPFGYRSTPLLVGRVLDSSGRGVLGAEVCVAARIGVAGVPERILATPMTGPGGRFKVRIPPGPTRRLRAAHWASTTTVAEDFRTLRVRARPRLTLAPGGVLRNGERVRFRVELPGPRAAGRHIALKVRANGRWLPLRRGRTNRRGVWTGGYRFRATSGRQTYKFSAFAPKQRGYPYATGRSKSKRQTVLG